MELSYLPVRDSGDAAEVLKKVCKDKNNDFVDAILFVSDRGTVIWVVSLTPP